MPAGRRKTPVDQTGVLRGVLLGGKFILTESLSSEVRSMKYRYYSTFRATGRSTADRPVVADDKDRRQGLLPLG